MALVLELGAIVTMLLALSGELTAGTKVTFVLGTSVFPVRSNIVGGAVV